MHALGTIAMLLDNKAIYAKANTSFEAFIFFFR